MRLTTFENFREVKFEKSVHIAVVTVCNTIETGWSNGRNLDELKEDFGELDKDWFYSVSAAHAQLIKNRRKEEIL